MDDSSTRKQMPNKGSKQDAHEREKGENGELLISLPTEAMVRVMMPSSASRRAVLYIHACYF